MVRDVSSSGSIHVLRKSVAVLDVLARRGELTAADLAVEIDEPRSSVYRLLSSLQELGMIRRGTRRGTFRLGFRLLDLGAALTASIDERQAGLETMQALRDKTGETIFMCIRRDREAVCIERIEGQHVQSLALRLGGSLPLYVGAAPRVLLAWENERFQKEYLRQERFKPYTSRTIANRRQLRASLDQALAAGYVVSDEDLTPGIGALGAPIFDYKGNVRAALSLSGTRPLIMDNLDDLVRLLVAGADMISRELGWLPDATAERRMRLGLAPGAQDRATRRTDSSGDHSAVKPRSRARQG